MDPVTHGLIGATATQSVSDEEHLRSVTFIGIISAMFADLDVFIDNPADPLLNIEIHRQFSHSLIFIPVGALIAAAGLWLFFRKKFSFAKIYGFSFLGYATAGITDTLTSYGTKLLWPFIDTRFNGDLISVFDPLFSVVILAVVLYAYYKKEPRISWWSLGWIGFYILIALVQQQRGKQIAHDIAASNEHKIEQLIVKPTIANQWLWSIRYTANDTLYAHGVHLGVLRDPKIYYGESTALLNWQEKYREYQGTTLYNDIHRFNQLSEGILIPHPHQKQVIGDGRYALLPTHMEPLWGIKIDTTKPNKHLLFKTFRKLTPKIRDKYINMLLGQEISAN